MSDKTPARRRIRRRPGLVNLLVMGIAAAVVVMAGCAGAQSSTASQPSSGSQTATTPSAQGNIAAVRYVALGDSFSSGEGNWPFLSGTEVPNGDQCHRSSLGYAMQLRNLGGPTLARPDFVACSGAQIQDLFNANHESNNAPSEPPQINRLNPSVGLVTMTMGGNNLGRNGQGLGDLLQYCYLHHSACHQDLQAGVTNQLHAIDGTRHDITNLYNLELVYKMLRRDAPNARILVAGYPHEFTGTYNGSCERIDQTDQVWMNQVVDSLNSVIKANIQAANKAFDARIEYVDPIPWFSGHALDNGSSCSWVGQAFNSTSITTLSHRDGWFHPNVLGQNLYARAFMKELRQSAPTANPSPATPTPSATSTSSCTSQTFLSVVRSTDVVMSNGYAKSVTPSGPPTCADGYALEGFLPYPGGQQAPFFFKQDASGNWALIEGGSAVPRIACTTIPPSVMTKLGYQCSPIALIPSPATPSPSASITPGHATPEEAVDGFFQARFQGNETLACSYASPASRGNCSSQNSQEPAIIGNIAFNGADVSGNFALVELTGHLCYPGRACESNTSPLLNMPASPASFQQVYLALVKSTTYTFSPYPCIRVGGMWYINFGP